MFVLRKRMFAGVKLVLYSHIAVDRVARIALLLT